MGHTVCFEAGWFTQTQSSRTATSCSRKWMSGPATALAQSSTDRRSAHRSAINKIKRPLQENLQRDAGKSVSSLDTPLSWLSPCRSPGFSI
jgi:hypothetical protein